LISELEDVLRNAYSAPLYAGDNAGVGDETIYSLTEIQPGSGPENNTLRQ
jgi:hypothetical protein